MYNTFGKVVFKDYNLTKGEVEISFDVRLVSFNVDYLPVATVQWNNQTIYTIYWSDNGKSIKRKVNVSEGLNNLRFMSLGGNVCIFCAFSIDVTYK